ncbi:hypothetical protein TNCV_315181 [Trichonephila clavipes]|nr:hypothetical protein TNCV_315181 [Trichonephila clavipes]
MEGGLKEFVIEYWVANSESLRSTNVILNVFSGTSTSCTSTSSSTQVHLLPSASTVATVSEPQPPNPTSNDAPSITNTTSPANSSIQPPSASTTASTKQNSKSRSRNRKKGLFKKLDETKIEIKMAPHKPRKPAPVEYTTDEEDMIVYDEEEDEI